MRLLFIAHCLGTGGSERVAANLSFGLARRHQIYFLGLTSERVYPFAGEYIPNPFFQDKKPELGALGWLVRRWRYVVFLRRLVRSLRIDVTVGFDMAPNRMAMLAGGSGRKVLSIHSHQHAHLDGTRTRLQQAGFKMLYKRADAVVFVSEYLRRAAVESWGFAVKKSRVIHNSFDVAGIRDSARQPIELEPARPLIGMCGRFAHPKGQWHLIRVFAELRKMMPQARLVLLGEGELKPALLGLIKSYELTDAVVMPGFQKNPYPWIARFDVLVLASYFEGFGNVLVEAMALGVPVISTDCRCGPREIITGCAAGTGEAVDVEIHKWGILCPPLEPLDPRYCGPLSSTERAMFRALDRLVRDKDLAAALSAGGTRRAEDFNADEIATKWERLFAEL